MKKILLLLCSVLFISSGMLAQDVQSEEYELPVISTEDALIAMEESADVDKQYCKLLKKSKRWNKKLAKQLEASLLDLYLYERQTKTWTASITNEYPDLELKDKKKIESEDFDLEMYRYLEDLESYANLLNSKWKAQNSPAIGESIEHSKSEINRLSDIRDQILNQERSGTLLDVNELNYRIIELCDRIVFLYKSQKEENVVGEQLFQVLNLANEILPVYKAYISTALVEMGKPASDAESFNRQIASIALSMGDNYLESIAFVSAKKQSSLNLLKETKEEEPEQIFKLKASLY